MTAALPLYRIPVPTAVTAPTRMGRIATVDLHHDFASAEPIWRYLESQNPLTTPYQSYDFLDSWHDHVGSAHGVAPFIVTAYCPAGRPLALLPLGRVNCGPLRLLQFLGGKHVNTNFGLWDREFAASANENDVRTVIEHIAASGHGIDLMALHRQPAHWDGIVNPLLLLPHQRAANDCWRRDLRRAADGKVDLTVSRGMRRQLRSKDRRIADLPGYRYFKATTPDDVDRLLTWFFPTKAAHLAAQGLPNAYADQAIQAFIRDICRRGLADGKPLAELHAIEAEDEVLALCGGTGSGRRFTAMFNSYTVSVNARYSPGLVLLTHMIPDLGERGFTSFDLGTGEAAYKRGFCPVGEPLFDSFLPLTALGHLAAAGAQWANGLKRTLKRTPRLWPAMQSLRRRVYARS